MYKTSLTAAALLLSGTAFAGDYPTAANERPLTKPSGMTQINADISAVGTQGVGFSADYGISDTMDVSLALPSYELGDDEVEGSGGLDMSLAAGLGYSLVDGDALDVAAGLYVPLNFNGEEGEDTLEGITIDANTRYALMDGALAIRTGHGMFNTEDRLGFISYTMGEAGGIGINLNLGLTYQITDAINADLDTNLFTKPAEGDSTSIADAQVINVGFGYNMDDIDVGLQAIDVTGESMGLGIQVGYRL